MRASTSVAALVLGLACVTACSEERSADRVTLVECQALREHMLDVRLSSSGLSAEAIAQHRDNLRSTVDASLAWCSDNVPANRFSCAMRAQTVDVLESCLSSPTTVNE